MKTENEEDNILLKLLKIRDDKLRSWKLVKLHINEAENEVQHFQNAISTIESFLHDNTWELSPGDQEDWLLWLDINREELLEAVEYYNKCKEDEIQASINYETANEKYKWTKERIISGQFGYISDEDWIENYGKLSLGHEDYCNEEFEFELEDEFVWDFQYLNLEGEPDIFYTSSLKFHGVLRMENGLFNDICMDSPMEVALELSIMKDMNTINNCRKYLSPNLQLVFDRGKGNLEFFD